MHDPCGGREPAQSVRLRVLNTRREAVACCTQHLRRGRDGMGHVVGACPIRYEIPSVCMNAHYPIDPIAVTSS